MCTDLDQTEQVGQMYTDYTDHIDHTIQNIWIVQNILIICPISM